MQINGRYISIKLEREEEKKTRRKRDKKNKRTGKRRHEQIKTIIGMTTLNCRKKVGKGRRAKDKQARAARNFLLVWEISFLHPGCAWNFLQASNGGGKERKRKCMSNGLIT